MAKTYKKPDIRLRFELGTIRVETFRLDYPDVTLGILPNLRFDLPSDAGPLQTLAMASLLSPEQIADQGPRERVESAQKEVSWAVSLATRNLEQFGVSRQQVQELVDASIRRNAEPLRTVVGR